MALPVTENFTDTDAVQLSTHNASWVMDGAAADFTISSNQLKPGGAGADFGAAWTGDTFNNDQKSKMTVVVAGSGPSIGVGCRMDASGLKNYYGVYCDGGGGTTYQVFKMSNAGGWTQIGSNITGIASGSVLEMRISGTTITVYDDGVSVFSNTDSTYASGRAGVVGANSGTNALGDVWIGDNLSASGSTASPVGTSTATVTATAIRANARRYAMYFTG